MTIFHPKAWARTEQALSAEKELDFYTEQMRATRHQAVIISVGTWPVVCQADRASIPASRNREKVKKRKMAGRRAGGVMCVSCMYGSGSYVRGAEEEHAEGDAGVCTERWMYSMQRNARMARGRRCDVGEARKERRAGRAFRNYRAKRLAPVFPVDDVNGARSFDDDDAARRSAGLGGGGSAGARGLVLVLRVSGEVEVGAEVDAEVEVDVEADAEADTDAVTAFDALVGGLEGKTVPAEADPERVSRDSAPDPSADGTFGEPLPTTRYKLRSLSAGLPRELGAGVPRGVLERKGSGNWPASSSSEYEWICVIIFAYVSAGADPDRRCSSTAIPSGSSGLVRVRPLPFFGRPPARAAPHTPPRQRRPQPAQGLALPAAGLRREEERAPAPPPHAAHSGQHARRGAAADEGTVVVVPRRRGCQGGDPGPGGERAGGAGAGKDVARRQEGIWREWSARWGRGARDYAGLEFEARGEGGIDDEERRDGGKEIGWQPGDIR
ncbi:hypothetical protein DFH09DRAFT_1286091 [Mycena vulgaris]|nr:hypothetical protein DFH09DRAFT_1286091 [Mycena vulgaris]